MIKPIAAFQNFIDTWQGQLSDMRLENKALPEQAIRDFQAFSTDFIDFFRSIITRKTTAMRLEFKTFMTLQEYWLPLEQIIMQWQTDHYEPLLREGQAEAKKYLEKLDVNLPGALVYFNKVASIKHVPYTPIPLLGMPYPFSGPENWSAIPHELGHYIYWNLGGELLETRERQEKMRSEAEQALKQQGIKDSMRNMIMDWFEEIFCDVLGTQLGKQEFIDSSSDYLKTVAGDEADLTRNDGSHPPLCIRPFIWNKVSGFATDEAESLFDELAEADIMTLEIQYATPVQESPGSTTPAAIIGPESIQFESFTVRETLSGVEALVDYLVPAMEAALKKIRQLRQGFQPPSAFSQMKKVVEMEHGKPDKFKGKEIFELLLVPRVLEGGYQDEPHTTWAAHGAHEVGYHYH